MWFRELYNKHGDEVDAHKNPLRQAKNAEALRQVDLEDGEDRETVDKSIKEKMLSLAETFEHEADDRDDENPFYANPDGVHEEAQWDCETILSTYTNTDNHPGVIKTTKRIRPSQQMKIELHKQFKVPLDGLIPMAEELVI